MQIEGLTRGYAKPAKSSVRDLCDRRNAYDPQSREYVLVNCRSHDAGRGKV
jgi:hypothetical protein